MSDPGRLALEKIFISPDYIAVANKTAGNKIDASKVAAEFQGQRRPQCASKFFQGFQTLCRENPPNGIPVPPVPPASAVDAVWRLDAAFTNGGLSNFAGAPRARAFQLGWTCVYVQLLHTTYAAANEREMALSQWNPFVKVGWGTYGQGSDPKQDGKDAAALCARLPLLKGWKANGEAWAEGTGSWKTQAFLEGWVQGGAPVPLGWSVLSSDTANFARSYPYQVALSVAGSDIDLQVYGATDAGYTVGAGLGMLTKAVPPVPVSRTTMSFDVNGDGNGPFPDYRTWAGPRRLWNPDRATVATFEALQR